MSDDRPAIRACHPEGTLRVVPERIKTYPELIENAARAAYVEWNKIHGVASLTSIELYDAMEELGRLLNANIR